MKKVIASVLLTCMAAMLLASCAGAPGAGTASAAAGTAPAPGDTPALSATPADTLNASSAASPAATLAKGETVVSDFEGLKAAAASKEFTVIHIGSDMEITEKFILERNDDLIVYVDKGVTLAVGNELITVSCSIINNGAMTISGVFEYGISNFTNNGAVTVKSGGEVCSGQSDADNNGGFTVDGGGRLLIDRGTIFNNFGALINNGNINVSDGGQLNDKGGSITNGGVIDLYSYFNGDITKITGSGTLNDHRQ